MQCFKSGCSITVFKIHIKITIQSAILKCATDITIEKNRQYPETMFKEGDLTFSTSVND